jgi:hypothetical protein
MENQLATLILLRYKEREDEAKLSKNSANKNDPAVCRSRKREA